MGWWHLIIVRYHASFFSNVYWTYFWFLMGHNDGRYQALASRLPNRVNWARPLPKTSSFLLLLALLTQFFTGRNLTEIFERSGPGYDNGLLSQTFYQLYMCYRDNSIVIRSGPSIIWEVGSGKTLLGFRRNTIAWWFDPSRSYLILEQSKAVIPLTVKLNSNQSHYFRFCVCFECFFLSMGLRYFN